MIHLRPYQNTAIDRLRASIRAGRKSPLLVSPTGSGKTRMFAYLVSKLSAAGRRCIVLDHRDELTAQISQALTDAGVQHGIITAGASYYDPRVTTHVASVFTLARRLDRVQAPEFVIVDEAHHCIAGSTWGKVIAYWRERNPALVVIGVTATPERLSGEGLSQVFDDMVLGPTTAELIADGWLSGYTLFSPPGQADMTGVKRVGGDYNKAEANARVDKPTITGSAAAHYRKHLNGAPAVAFCGSVQHAEHVADTFRAQGFRAASIDGKMDKVLRRDTIRDFGEGRLNILTSCDLISEGFDVPGIVGAILLRPTESLGLYLQQVGRSLRPVYGDGADMTTAAGRLKGMAFGPKPKAIIIDHVGNSGQMDAGNFIVKHGMPCDERDWSLHGRERKKGGERDPDDMPVKQCKSCYAINRALAQACRECGAVFVIKARIIAEVEGDLAEVDPLQVRAQFMQARASAADIESLAQVGRMRGMKNPEGWAKHVLQARAEKQSRRRA